MPIESEYAEDILPCLRPRAFKSITPKFSLAQPLARYKQPTFLYLLLLPFFESLFCTPYACLLYQNA